MNSSYKKGFTVLELLVVLGIITIMLALVFTGLNIARRQSGDERRIANLRPVVVELREYFNICRSYPVGITQADLIDPTAPCSDLINQIPSKTIRDVIPTAYDLNFNATGSDYHYQALATSLPGDCTNFHMWVNLQNAGGTLLQQKSNKTSTDYAPSGLISCNNVTAPTQLVAADKDSDLIFDIFK